MTDFVRNFLAEPFTDKNGAIITGSTHTTPVALSTNQTVVTVGSGQKGIILEYTIASSGAASYVMFKNGSGGANLRFVFVPANTVDDPNIHHKLYPVGLIIGGLSTNIVVDIGAVRCDISINYLLWKP